MAAEIDPEVRALAEAAIAGKASKRAKLALQAFLEEGSISTDELAAKGYGHPPRVVMDIKDAGIPIITTMVRSERNGRPMAVYSLGTADAIQQRAQSGRKIFSKAFKKDLILKYGLADRFSGAVLDAKVLTIDHRVPYSIAGDASVQNVADYMLLDASSQRAKSWACEHCPNMALDQRQPEVCMTCYWAYPESYEHIATQQIRRTDIAWQGADVAVHDRLQALAMQKGTTVAELIKRAARKQ